MRPLISFSSSSLFTALPLLRELKTYAWMHKTVYIHQAEEEKWQTSAILNS
jgi:hypothetical protein